MSKLTIKDKILDDAAKKHMVEWNLAGFKRKFKHLYKTIMVAMDVYMKNKRSEETIGINIAEFKPKHGQKCIIETNICLCWATYINNSFYIEDKKSDIISEDDVFWWIPYPEND